MWAFIGVILVGILCITIGISNRKGNLASLHNYHTHRVSEEDRIPFGKKVGLGTIILGLGSVFLGILSILTLLTEKQIFIWIGNFAFLLALIVGLFFIFYGLIRYNKGIF